ncbi:MAG: 3-deoxy-manno-octulosonate cytidylyltransferase [Zetaproteobacteria bacterium]|nr:MAG: 3-deoxy-manno-octulosonate cytidylyltransferase [Zetaproteobacteria bacterium]
MKLAIAIPARYASTRFPGKPLAMIQGKSMLQRVLDLAHKAAEPYDDVTIFVATEDRRIADHVAELGATCIMTPPSCPTGSDRVLSAIRQFHEWPDFIINLQGDAPFTPPKVIRQIFDAFEKNPRAEVITPVHRLSWNDLDRLRKTKKTTPFSGTTAIIDEKKRALWFSKNIIPAIRNEDGLRKQSAISPIHQHIGLYGFRSDILENFCGLAQGEYEQLEGLEQLRMLENGIMIQTVHIDIDEGLIQSGIDSPEDIIRAENHIMTYGEPIK